MTIIRQAPDILRLSFGSLADIAEIERLQQLLRVDPTFRDARLTLMTATRAPQSVRAEQLYWFAEHEPKTFLVHYGWMATADEGLVAGDCYEEGRRRWLLAAESHRDDPDVVENAAWFMIHFEPERGAELIDGRSRREPDPEWSRRAMAYLDSARRSHALAAVSLAARALEAGYRVFRREDIVERGFDLLPTMRDCAKASAMTGAMRPLELAETAGWTWRRADAGLRPQLAETVLGLVALAEGDTDRAEDRFARAVAAEALPSEALVSFAAELVATGAEEAALRAIQTWESRFRDCEKVATEWASAIRAGARGIPPTFPPKRSN